MSQRAKRVEERGRKDFWSGVDIQTALARAGRYNEALREAYLKGYCDAGDRANADPLMAWAWNGMWQWAIMGDNIGRALMRGWKPFFAALQPETRRKVYYVQGRKVTIWRRGKE